MATLQLNNPKPFSPLLNLPISLQKTTALCSISKFNTQIMPCAAINCYHCNPVYKNLFI